MLEIRNHGPLILSTNFWEWDHVVARNLYLSSNAGGFRLLVPRAMEDYLPEFQTAKGVAVSRGPWPAGRQPEAIEVLFDDGTASPFAVHLAPESVDRFPTPEDVASEWVFSVWTAPRRGRPHKALERPCRYRLSHGLPDLRPWGKP